MMQDPIAGSPLSDYAQFYSGSNAPQPCLLGDAGMPVDVGESDVYATTCPTQYPSVGVIDNPGPVQAMAFVVPYSSNQDSISQEAAREVFGIGGNDGGAQPWVDPSLYFVRNKNTGTQQIISKAIDVPANQFWGIDRGSAQAVASLLGNQSGGTPATTDSAIGILSVAVYDTNRTVLKTLAFKAGGQNVAFLPDSTTTSYDKQNVRDGHYPLWGPLHFFTPNTQLMMPSTQAESFISFFQGSILVANLLDAYINASLIPLCAMSVQRMNSQELGELQPSALPSCECYFLQQAHGPQSAPAPLPPECTTCEADSNCSPPRSYCHLGFCEVQ
jgi:hypothetical protein